MKANTDQQPSHPACCLFLYADAPERPLSPTHPAQAEAAGVAFDKSVNIMEPGCRGRVFMPWMIVIYDANNEAVAVKICSAHQLRVFTVKIIRLGAIDPERP